jgi:hypothetical protein
MPDSLETTACPVVQFPPWFDQRCEREMPARGYLSDVTVKGENGNVFRVYFIDPVRLRQTLEDDAIAGKPFIAEPGMIVIPEVTVDAIQKAVAGLWREGFFQHLKPI